MCLFSHILTTLAQFNTQILPRRQKRRYRLCKINVYGFVLDKMEHISLTEFGSISWLPTKERVHQCINAIIFKFVNKNCSFYLVENFKFALHCRIDTRNSFVKLKHLFTRLTRGRKPSRILVPLCGTIYSKPLKNK